ncbi:MAG TPA: phytoene/squalene synthase family protein [Chitinophagaceae bacterium]
MKSLFDKVSEDVCKLTTRTYSTSFSWGIVFLDRRIRNGIYAIYGFVRLADEIVDSFHGYDKAQLLYKLKKDTSEAISWKISCNPVLNAFQQTVHKYGINLALIETFLASMEMDLHKVAYDKEQYEQYILGSAEVVGLMCLHVLAEGDKERYEELRPYSMKLGAAFQKVNFLRDMHHDKQQLGRMYFPSVKWNEFNGTVKKEIEADIEADFRQALQGIKKLPASSKAGVYMAYVYYRSLFRKIRKMESHDVMTRRVRISNGRKLGLMMNSLLEYKMNLI